MKLSRNELILNLPEPYLEINFLYRPPGWSLDLHQHNYYQLILVTAGILSFRSEYSSDQLGKGQMCLIPPQQAHALQTADGYAQFGINFSTSPDERGLIALLNNNIQKTVLLNRSDFLDQIPLLQAEAKNLSQLSRLKLAGILDHLLISSIENNILNIQLDFKDRLLAALTDRLAGTVKLEEICEVLLVSQSQLERLCRKAFNCSVIELAAQMKTNQACSLLSHQGRSIREVADDLGFCDQAYFSRFFKKRTGLTPRAYRRDMENN